MSAMDTLLSIKVFRQVVESSSFVEAAGRLNLSKGMISKHLMHLEKHLGTRLFNRSSRSSSLPSPTSCSSNAARFFLEGWRKRNWPLVPRRASRNSARERPILGSP
jgi:regulatory helix-turn-helix LysR family protein